MRIPNGCLGIPFGKILPHIIKPRKILARFEIYFESLCIALGSRHSRKAKNEFKSLSDSKSYAGGKEVKESARLSSRFRLLPEIPRLLCWTLEPNCSETDDLNFLSPPKDER